MSITKLKEFVQRMLDSVAKRGVYGSLEASYFEGQEAAYRTVLEEIEGSIIGRMSEKRYGVHQSFVTGVRFDGLPLSYLSGSDLGRGPHSANIHIQADLARDLIDAQSRVAELEQALDALGTLVGSE